ncbi:MAG: NUDIX domain-containing protein [Nanoarchaeota archaeon]|nr:NUDIX domain-containing protein [Nanoarchaeota archaeon]
MAVAHNPSEILAVVDNNDNIINKAPREEVHARGMWHREICCFIINLKKQLLLQRRKDNHLWDGSCAGHFPFSQTYEEAVIRETEEELGIHVEPNDLKELAKEKLAVCSKINNRFAKVFVVQKDIPLEIYKIDKAEVEEVKYFSKAEINALLLSNEVTPTSKYLIGKYILALL